MEIWWTIFDKCPARGRDSLSDPYAIFKKSIYERWEIMEDAYLDSYWESQFDIQEQQQFYWEAEADVIMAQWDEPDFY